MITKPKHFVLFFATLVCFINCKEKQPPKSVATSPLGADTLLVEPMRESTDESKQDTLSYRDQNWYPERGQYYFSESYHFEYYNETISPEEAAAKGEFGF